ncbi:TBC domain-containing protein C4G8.04 [Ceratocystis fimbriata CBS 114723]|uniref:TBC domain-containing protein C4G8.04 n=1 Tax=Ceratocystis fimbriata CBS 114723 TaxID=1035309 RepID=A0A2C5X0F6_9PEZI|nr:TBC domain-containing protein C4G8.04 [Ceratocystis fimbriata CBS 114723]
MANKSNSSSVAASPRRAHHVSMSSSMPVASPVSGSPSTSALSSSASTSINAIGLKRSTSAHSAASSRSHRSVRTRRRPGHHSQQSPSTSSINTTAANTISDKSLTSFPSFSGESPRLDANLGFSSISGKPNNATTAAINATSTSVQAKSLAIRPSLMPRTQSAAGSLQNGKHHNSTPRDRFGIGIVPSPALAEPVTTPATTSSAMIVENLTRGDEDATESRGLFEDDPIAITKIPGALHLAGDDHIERLIARHGAVSLVRQIAEDLAMRDVQMSAARRRAEERERALRRICRESGLSNLELEQRLKAVETEMRDVDSTKRRPASMLSDMMSDAMDCDVLKDTNDATIRAVSNSTSGVATGGKQNPSITGTKGTIRGWKDYIWGGTAKKTDSPSHTPGKTGVVRGTGSGNDKRPPLQESLFHPPEQDAPGSSHVGGSVRSSSRSSAISIKTTESELSRKTSLASLALRLVAGGGSTSVRDSDTQRGRSKTAASNLPAHSGTVSARPSPAARALSMQLAPKGSMGSVNSAKSAAISSTVRRSGATPISVPARGTLPERWDTMKNSPPGAGSSTDPIQSDENFGPVEMDTILPPDAQPPTLTHIYNRYAIREKLLTDRYGFIYDQRRKKRQRDAAKLAQSGGKDKRSIHKEMLTSNGARASISPNGMVEEGGDEEEDQDACPPSPSQESAADVPKSRWQDYLKVATFPTELLAHMPSINMPFLEVTEGSDLPSKSPTPSTSASTTSVAQGKIRGFAPTASTTTSAPVSTQGETSSSSDSTTATTATATSSSSTTSLPSTSQHDAIATSDDTEPVKLLLKQLSDMHDHLQRERTVRWNDFLRKVRAERKREGEAAAAAAAAAAEARFEAPAVILPEAKLTDGEMIGVSGLGNKGKVGRAKWNEFKTLVLSGIPVAYRAKIWAECSGATGLRIPGYYDDIVAQGKNGLDETVVSQIDMDIRRTLTDNIFFRKGPGVEKLNEVLLAYAHRNPDVGYCQGMNLIAANLLLITPAAEDAFWILASIVELILPSGYYDHWLLASRADQHVLREYVASVLPRLSSHLDALGIELEALTFQWFLSVFTDCLSAEALFRVWDVVLCTHDGSTFLFQVALALLKLNEPALLSCEGSAAVYTYINHQMTNHAISIDGLVQASEGLRRLVKRDDVMEKRERAQEREREVLRQRELRLAAVASV